MTDYEPPPPEHAAFVHQKNAECDEQRQRLNGASVETAWAIATDITEADAARLEAVLILLREKDARIPDLVLSLFDEPETRVWSAIIISVHPDDPRIRQRLRERARSDDKQAAGQALCVLARMKDEAVENLCREWLGGEQGENHAAIEALRIARTDRAVQILRDRWSENLATDKDRHALAMALIEFDHEEAIEHADKLAKEAQDGWSVAAATRIFFTRKEHGLTLMLHILKNGTLEAKQAMVSQISSVGRTLSHAYTADGIHEALLWVETELAEH